MADEVVDSKLKKVRKPWDEVDSDSGQAYEDIPGVEYPDEFKAGEAVALSAMAGAGAAPGVMNAVKDKARQSVLSKLKESAAPAPTSPPPAYHEAVAAGNAPKFSEFIRKDASTRSNNLGSMGKPESPAAMTPPIPEARTLMKSYAYAPGQVKKLQEELQQLQAAGRPSAELNSKLQEIRQLRDPRWGG